jgi:hypothetical protein
MSEAHHVRSPETWAAVRNAYASGISAPDLCERYAIPRSTFFARAAAEGWRRADQLDAAPLDDLYPVPDDDAPLRTAAQLADAAWLGVDRAMARGHAADAERWMRLHRQFRALAAEAARDARREGDEATDGIIKTCDAIRHAADAGRRETETLIEAMKAGVPLDQLDALDRDSSPPPREAMGRWPEEPEGPRDSAEAGSPPSPASPTLDPLDPSTPALSPLKRSMLEAQLSKAQRRGDHAAAHRLRAKLAGARVATSSPEG